MSKIISFLTLIFLFASYAKAQCDATFYASNTSCNSIIVDPVNASNQYSYQWDFGDGNTSSDIVPNHTYTSNGTYTISLVITDTTNNCTDSSDTTIVIDCFCSPSIDASFTFDINSSNCVLTFTPNVSGGTPPYTYYWDFGDGNTSTDTSPSNQYPDNTTWNVCMTITDSTGCDTTVCNVADSFCPTAGISEHDSDQLVVYPNPSHGIFKIDLKENTEIIVYTLSGAVLYKEQFIDGAGVHPLNLTHLEKGIYLLEFKTSETSGLRRIVIK